VDSSVEKWKSFHTMSDMNSIHADMRKNQL